MQSNRQHNHRWNIRHPISLDISLFNGDSGALQTKTENISMGGVFIKPLATDFDINQDLVITLSLQTKQGISQHRIPAYVVRSNSQGIGLNFNDCNIETIHMLREVLYSDLVET